MKKTLKLGAAACLSLSLVLSGCASKSEGTKTEGAPSSPITSSAPEKAPEKSTAPVKLSVLVSGPGLSEDDKALQGEIGKKLNINFDYNAIAPGSNNEYVNQINVRVASNNAPDVFTVSNDQMLQFTKQGAILDLTKYLDKMPNVKKAYTEIDLAKGKVDGKQMTLPKRATVPYRALMIRQDWLDKLKMPVPKTIEELAATINAFHDKDPDGNGKQDTYGLTGYGLDAFAPIFGAFGTSYGYFNASLSIGNLIVKDNKAMYSTTQPEMKQALTYISDLFAKGAIDPDLLTNKGTAAPTKAQKGQVGMIYANWSDMFKDEHIKLITETNPNAKFIAIEPPVGPGGKFMGAFDDSAADWRVALPKSLEKTPEKLDRALAYLDYITGAGEGQNLVMFGNEGVHYTKSGTTITPLPEMSKLGTTYQLQLTGRDELPYLYTKFPKQKEYIDQAVKQPYIKVFNNFSAIPEGVNKSDKDRYENEEMIKFMFGKRPLAEFDSFLKTLNTTYQLQKYVDEASKAFKSQGLIK
ncbi:extracellular solute-binding protein [Paenibacillus qinlingensis]|uniref:Aldouronate transport system substrate-binding protein n=1 Tax=Paenibacillus qinlingensis TaxID=1837343 RepID=A0ABU1P7P9_9BACL|nr:extracellular solute-binding protein [Paenibacillus qinlingensis]MDR6555212.1 putative aldouronate transport system substrate-binding protein [Paenibacillus qinlingensis]